ncbi:MAG: hypothetical protein HXX16_12150 [Bacteroidales bacterium]|nr:hypothetical protein [Bacteroidales bacterium]
MKTKNLLSLLLIAVVLIFASCKKDDPSPLTKDQAVTALTTIDNGYATDVTDLAATQGHQVADVLDGMNLPFGSLPQKSSANAQTFLKEQKDILVESALSKRIVGGTPDFEFVPGTYTYEKSTNSFTKTLSTPTDKMVLLFPFPISNANNNATLTIYDYQSTTLLNSSVPTQLKGKIEIGGQTIWTIVATAAYSNLVNYNYNIVTTFGKFVSTRQFSINISNTQITSTALDELKKDGAIVYQFSSNGVYKPSQTSFTADVNAKIIVKNIEIRIEFTFDFNTYQNVTDPNTIEKISVYTTDGAKVGDVKLVKVENSWIPYIFFNNGESKPVSEYFHNLLEFIGGCMESLYYNPNGK